MMRGQRCDALKPDGTRCRCVISRDYLESHYVRNGLNLKFGLLCANHWKVVHRGRKVRLRPDSHVFLRGGAVICTPRGLPGAIAAAGFVPVRQGKRS